MFTEKDIQQIKEKGLTASDVVLQVDNFVRGFSFLNILKPATINDGILKIEKEIESFISLYEQKTPDTIKFVPASGAASRMFKFLFEFYSIAKENYKGVEDIKDHEVKKFFINLKRYAFYHDLSLAFEKNGFDIEVLLEEGRFKQVLKYLLFEDGLDYGQKPKGVLLFHKYKNEVRTAFEEHLAEGANHSCSVDKKVKIHFTISLEHKELFDELVQENKTKFEKEFGLQFDLSFSQQKPSTDMVAVDLDNKLFRNADGSLLFRPGGHGALIENLNDLDADIVFVKNIDNVVIERLKDDTIIYKKALAGVLLFYRERIFKYTELLESKKYSVDQLNEIKEFIQNELCYHFDLKDAESKDYCAARVFEVLNRPIRVCGMVKNEGEPGGGPFWVKQDNGVVNLQILESSQIDQDDVQQIKLLKSATHFNPVDLVCTTKDYKGEKFDLLKYRDPGTGFISKKSKDGNNLKAQELPGLWNGAMAHWNTIFVEVPIMTFNPVKTVNDLLRPEHQ